MIDSLSGVDLDPSDVYLILKSLSNPRYKARTAKGIAYETNLPESVVEQCLENHLLSVSCGRSKDQALYTFRCNSCNTSLWSKVVK
jgi:hypothetical protein